MRKVVSVLTLCTLLIGGQISWAGETYESQEARLKITFPGEFEVEKDVDEESGMTTFSLSCTYGDMILIGNVFIFSEPVSDDDNALTELLEVLRICSAFGAKYKDDNVTTWSVGNDSGWSSYLKCGGDWKGYVGRYYVIVQETFEWQFLILGSKKTYDMGLEARFINSFEILD